MSDPNEDTPRWRKSSRCPVNEHCVEVAEAGDRVLMRNSTHPVDELSFGLDQWREFLRAVRSGNLPE
ncbi:hypothetical protein BJ973_002084 [Actinoplanes tereljensis]|uniref:DUF397 domain-containing protein n=1 Tax=Paractinoplanes tereljensis TaxID=571912 RepID=A0A919NJR0_9ACTN|nr:DUF397 domain-containing protein [Actinoplanes tereljensis]GIF20011.1 hypothetical protein Ate02nite_27410 [Actinoplanes tereljensis]